VKVQRIMHLRIRQDYFQPPDMKGGVTVIIDGDTDTARVQVRSAFCHPHDVFCKAKGRFQAEASDVDVIPLRMLPGVLGGLWREAHKRAHVKPRYRPEYDCRIRDFLPRE
jgi:hypothetical protein